MKKIILLLALLFSALWLGSCSLKSSRSAPKTDQLLWPENFIDIQTNLAASYGFINAVNCIKLS